MRGVVIDVIAQLSLKFGEAVVLLLQSMFACGFLLCLLDFLSERLTSFSAPKSFSALTSCHVFLLMAYFR